MAWKVVLDGPVDLDATLRSGQTFRCDPLPSSRGTDCWSWTIDGAVLRLMAPRRRPKARTTTLTVDVLAGTSSKPQVEALLRKRDPYRAWCADLSVDALSTAALAASPGMRLLHQPPWETTVAFICSSANNQRRIRRMLDSLAVRLGSPLLTPQGEEFARALPTPQAIAACSEAQLRALGLGYRAATLLGAARRVAAKGEVATLHACAELPLEKARAHLCQLPGVGPKVADCISLFALDHLEAFPLDVWMIRVLAQGYHLRGPRSYPRMQRWVWRHLPSPRGYLQQFLYHHGRALGREGVAGLRHQRAPFAGDMAPR